MENSGKILSLLECKVTGLVGLVAGGGKKAYGVT